MLKYLAAPDERADQSAEISYGRPQGAAAVEFYARVDRPYST